MKNSTVILTTEYFISALGQCCFMDCQLYQFHYINENKTWTEAQQYCREKHTDLVTVTNMKDMKRLISILPKYWRGAWIGLYYQANGNRKWHWSQSEVKFNESEKNWNTNEPNDATGWQNCGIIWKNLKWGDISCNDPQYFLCYEEKYILVKENKTWEDALTYCRDHHHDLVTITDMDDQRWIQEKVKVASTGYVWMGLSYACTLDLWFWVSDEVVSYKNWASGEPMDDCDMSGAMETRGKHQWRKKDDTEKFNFICSIMKRKYLKNVVFGTIHDEKKL
uniref:C-type lectin domain-containing protein n=1 Tax=Poecilia reticulata TaxID=8081 RepID=A0A3P9NMM1_POERE